MAWGILEDKHYPNGDVVRVLSLAPTMASRPSRAS